MKFRVPEVILGALISAAVFATGVLFAPSFIDRPHTTPVREGRAFWEKAGDDPVAYFTLWLVGFTAILAVSTIGLWIVAWFSGRKQSRDMQESLRINLIAANAADLSARAAVAIQLPVIRIQPDNLGHGESQVGDEYMEECSVDSLALSNLGPTKAYPIEVLHGWAIGSELPVRPDYRYVDQFLPNFILEPNPKIIPRKRLTLAMPLKPGEWQKISSGNYLWFYCALRYQDFMGEMHSHGFCWRWANTGNGLGWRIQDDTAYNLKT